MQVDFLVRVPALVVARHVAGDRDQRDRVERGGGDPGDRVHHARADVQQQHAGLARCPGVPVGGVRGRLLVPRDDELDPGPADGVEQGDVGVPAGAEDVLDSVGLQLGGQRLGGGDGHAPSSPKMDIPRSRSVLTTV